MEMPKSIWIKVEEGHHARFISVQSVPATEHTEYIPASLLSDAEKERDEWRQKAEASRGESEYQCDLKRAAEADLTRARELLKECEEHARKTSFQQEDDGWELRAKESMELATRIHQHMKGITMNRDQMDILRETNEFYSLMIKAMLAAYFDGKQGWNDPNCKFWNGDFEAEILRRVAEKIQAGAKGNEVDIANYMMMLRYLRKLPVPTTDERPKP